METLRLHRLEKIILYTLKQLNKPSTFGEVAEKAYQLFSGVAGEDAEAIRSPSAVAKACGWLQSKGLVSIEEKVVSKTLTIGAEGIEYARNGLPERRLVESLKLRGGSAGISVLSQEMPSLAIALNWAKRNGWVEIGKDEGGETVVRLTGEIPSKTPAEELLDILMLDGGVDMKDLDDRLRKAAEELLKRQNVVKLAERREHIISLTDEGLRIASELALLQPAEIFKEVTKLTPELLLTGRWREVTLSSYDVKAPVPPVFSAKRHPLTQLIRLVKQAYTEMGFEEIKGPIVELAFWNFDALFQPQDHPAREMQDTFYIDTEERGVPPRQYVNFVKAVHEHGGGTGSRGWGYKWSEEEASRLILRTHTTATTIRHLAAVRKPPIKVFSVDRIYRNEKVDWKHLAEFHQIEGIVVDERANFRQLMGVIKEFYSRLGLRQVRFRPSYFPYTEPSAEVEVFLAGKWLELGGMGIFRPETTHPLGVKHPVLAWGLGLERLAMIIYGVEDIRTFTRNDLNWLRRTSPFKAYETSGRVSRKD